MLMAFRAKKLGRDVAYELQFEDPYNDFVAQILAQKDSKAYEPPEKYSDLKALFEEHYDAPLQLHQALFEYQFQLLDNWVGFDQFSIDRILAYTVQLILVEKWLELDKKKGMEIVENFMKESS